MNMVTLPLPDQVSQDEARLLLALKLFETGRLSCGKAAELAGYSKRAFMEMLNRHGVAVLNSAADEVASDLANA